MCKNTGMTVDALDHTSANPGPAAPDNAPASQGGTGEHQQALIREPLKLHKDEAESQAHEGLAGFQGRSPGFAVHPTAAEADIALVILASHWKNQLATYPNRHI